MPKRNFNGSRALFDEALKYLPGGVNSPVRAFKAVGGTPPFIARGKGSHLWDVDGNEYIDYICSWGPLIFGHADDEIVAAVIEAAHDGTSFGAPTERETHLAKLVCEMHPACEMVRFVNSGTEATMSAVRLARGITGRPKIIKFAGCYHGHADSFLISAGSGALTLGTPSSPGVTESTAGDTLICLYNSLESVRTAFDNHKHEIAAVIVEPVAGNTGCIPPVDGFLDGLRTICTENGSVLIFDEVMTGFRIAKGGATERYGIMPDLVTLGKIIGNGLPVGAYGGPRELMEQISPSGAIYQAGTLSGNPLAMAAGIATLQKLNRPGVYDELERKSARLADGIAQIQKEFGTSYTQTRVGSMFSIFFTEEPVLDDSVAIRCDQEKFRRWFWKMLEAGIYLAPSQFEAGFVSMAHSDDDIDITINAAQKAFRIIT
ncbi:MAG TPA: glutamate-1-semialdehyde-2,1-aminomutase [Firmicutes bacterium]|nr:glutamate-1-semialdehyde-2,1-aminomutase [Bacillota bacterium]